jgi:hypothetical protein
MTKAASVSTVQTVEVATKCVTGVKQMVIVKAVMTLPVAATVHQSVPMKLTPAKAAR